MTNFAGFITRSKRAAWRDLAGEVVIVEDDGNTVHLLNRTAACIWTLADGTRRVEEISEQVSNRFEVSSQEALADTEVFCRQLVQAGLIALHDEPPSAKEAADVA